MTGRTAGRCCTLILAHTNCTHTGSALCPQINTCYLRDSKASTHTHTQHAVVNGFSGGGWTGHLLQSGRLCVFWPALPLIQCLSFWYFCSRTALWRLSQPSSEGELALHWAWVSAACVWLYRVLDEWVLHEANSFHLWAFLWDKCAQVYTNSDQRNTPSVPEDQEGGKNIFKNIVLPSMQFCLE